MSEITKKKRGRKPKNIINNLNVSVDKNINNKEEKTEEENIILHLPITLNYIINYDNNTDISLFIKNEDEQKKIEDSETTTCGNTSIKNNTKVIKTESNISPTMSSSKITCNNVNKISTHNLVFNNNVKCWWCKNLFEMPPVQLPEDYYNNTFYCIGHFCSFNCTKSYNLDLNDLLLWKRESLLNLLYYLTYSEYKYIEPSPHWLILEEFGGILSIDDFNKNSNDDHNTSEYIVCSGNRVKIDWPKVVTMTNKGALTVNSNSYKVTPDRKPNLFIVHWDACLNSTSCASVLKERGLSVHFCIDNDGTIYQLVDTANIAYHASGINQTSIGVEISNAFYTKYQSYYLKNGFGARPVLKNTKVHAGNIDEHMMFYPVQEQALSALIKAVCGAYGIPLAVPKLNGSYATGEHQEVASGKFKGVACHFHATSRKIDCAGLDLEKIIK